MDDSLKILQISRNLAETFPRDLLERLSDTLKLSSAIISMGGSHSASLYLSLISGLIYKTKTFSVQASVYNSPYFTVPSHFPVLIVSSKGMGSDINRSVAKAKEENRKTYGITLSRSLMTEETITLPDPGFPEDFTGMGFKCYLALIGSRLFSNECLDEYFEHDLKRVASIAAKSRIIHVIFSEFCYAFARDLEATICEIGANVAVLSSMRSYVHGRYMIEERGASDVTIVLCSSADMSYERKTSSLFPDHYFRIDFQANQIGILKSLTFVTYIADAISRYHGISCTAPRNFPNFSEHTYNL